MTRYDVYGVGSALVDIEFKISIDHLQDLGLDKGVMTLITEEDHHQLLDALDGQAVKRSCGGSAANTMIAMSQFGGQAFYSCKVATDEPGRFYQEDLLSAGVDTNHHNSETGVTGKCLVFVTPPDADRTMATFLGISEGLSAAELVPDAIADATYLYIEGYLVTGDHTKATAVKAREIAQGSGRKVALSLSDLNMVQFFRDGLLEVIGDGVDFLFANEVEALKMAETEDLGQAIAHLQSLAKQFAITLGPKGSLIFDGQTVLEIPAVKVDAVDTLGAGDMYAGALLYGITHGMDFAQAGRLASLASATLVTRFGPRMPTEATRELLAAL